MRIPPLPKYLRAARQAGHSLHNLIRTGARVSAIGLAACGPAADPPPAAEPHQAISFQDAGEIQYPNHTFEITPAYDPTVCPENGLIAEYLSAHPQVEQAMIGLEGTAYNNWACPDKTKLGDFFSALSGNEPLPLSFAGSPPPIDSFLFDRQTANEVYLANAAQSLWVEITRQVPWSLSEYDLESLQLLLNGNNLFSLYDANAGLYAANESTLKAVTPGNPETAFNFMINNPEDGSLPAGSQRETIFALTRWVRDHLHHGTTELIDLEAAEYPAQPTVEMLTARRTNPGWEDMGERYFAPAGCHSAAGLMIMLARSVNIPARGLASYIQNDDANGHAGVGFPAQDLYIEHTDNLYAVAELEYGLPAIEPEQLYMGRAEYLEKFSSFTGHNCFDYYSRIVWLAAHQPTFYYIDRMPWFSLSFLNEFCGAEQSFFTQADADEIYAGLEMTIAAYGGIEAIEAGYDAWFENR